MMQSNGSTGPVSTFTNFTVGCSALGRAMVGLAAAAVLAGCAEQELILQGERLDLRAAPAGTVAVPYDDGAEVDRSFASPDISQVSAWTHRAGNAAHFVSNPSFSAAPTLAWSVDIGQGNSRKHRITAQPIIADGLVFALDSQSQITAVSTNGATVWSRNLTPPEERPQDASGGGLAWADGKIYATTGFGEVIAMDAASGGEIWRQNLNAPATASPTVVDGIVYAVGRDNRAWAMDAATGRVRWDLPGTPDVSGIVGGASPAVTERMAIIPFGSGELVAALRQGGVRLWGSAVSGKREGRAYANISDITADPVVVGNVIYTANQSGRAVALNLSSGTRIWTAREGASGPVAVAGNSVFMISDQAELIRLSAATGDKIWGEDLPFLRRERAKRAKAIFAHYGPVFAGNALWVASDTGTLKSYDPATGGLRGSFEIPGGAASLMSFAGGTMYVLSERGQLHAFR